MSTHHISILSPKHATRILAFHGNKPHLLLKKNEDSTLFVHPLLKNILDDEIQPRSDCHTIRINYREIDLLTLASDAIRLNSKPMLAAITTNILEAVAAVFAESMQIAISRQTGTGTIYSFEVAALPSLSDEKPLELIMRMQDAEEPQKNATILKMAKAVVSEVLSAVDKPLDREGKDWLAKQAIIQIKSGIPKLLDYLASEIETAVRASIPKMSALSQKETTQA